MENNNKRIIYWLIEYQIIKTNPIQILWRIVRRKPDEILEVKGLNNRQKVIPPDKFAAGKGKLFTYEKKQSELCWIMVNDATYITGKE